MRHQLSTPLTLCVCALLSATQISAQVARPIHAPPRTGQMLQEQMEVVARKFNLGARRADSERPRTTQSGHGDKAGGYYQCFERGCVYYGGGTEMRERGEGETD